MAGVFCCPLPAFETWRVRPGPESVMGDREEPQSQHLSQRWPQPCPAVRGPLRLCWADSSTSSTFRPVTHRCPAPAHITGTLGLRKRRQKGESMLS